MIETTNLIVTVTINRTIVRTKRMESNEIYKCCVNGYFACFRCLNQRQRWTENRYYMEAQLPCSCVKFWQDFGVVGTRATDSAGSIRLYAHSTETRSSAPTAVGLRQRGQREGNIRSLAWGTSVVSLLLTL